MSKAEELPGQNRGRKSTYEPRHADTAARMLMQGATIDEVAIEIGVHRSVIYDWRGKYPEFADALAVPRGHANARVVDSLYAKATGYERVGTKIMVVNGVVRHVPVLEYYPPDLGAITMWLKNRVPGEWRDIKTMEIDGQITVNRGDRELAMAVLNAIMDAQRLHNGQNIEGVLVGAQAHPEAGRDDGGQGVFGSEAPGVPGAGAVGAVEKKQSRPGKPIRRRR